MRRLLAALLLVIPRWAYAVALCCSLAFYISPTIPRVLSWQGANSSSNYCSGVSIRVLYGSPTTCTYFPTITDLGNVGAVWWSFEGGIATTETKNPAIVNGASQLQYGRADSTSSPTSATPAWDDTAKQGCPDGPNVPTAPCYPNCGTCYVGMSNVTDGTVSTCFARRRCVGGSNPGTVCTSDGTCTGGTCEDTNATRGVLSAKGLGRMVSEVNAQAQTARPGAQNPLHIAVIRWDLVTPEEMQIAGFSPAWRLLPTSGTKHSAFLSWLTGNPGTRNDPLCKTTNADCTGKNGQKACAHTYPPTACTSDADCGGAVGSCASLSGYGLLDVANTSCVDGGTCAGGSNVLGRCTVDGDCPGSSCTQNTFTWENFATGACAHNFTEFGYSGSVYSAGHGWSSGSYEGKYQGYEYDTLLTLLGGDPDNAIYYYTRPGGSMWAPSGLLMNEENDAYIAWKVQRAKNILSESHADLIHLNHKIFQYQSDQWNYILDGTTGVAKYDGQCRACAAGSRAGKRCTADSDCPSSACNSVATMRASPAAGTLNPTSGVDPVEVICVGDGGWSGSPASYTVDDYTNGLEKIAGALRAAGVPFQWTINGQYWNNTTYPTATANAHIRAVTYAADLVFDEGTVYGADSSNCQNLSDCTSCTGSYQMRCEIKKRGHSVYAIGSNTFSAATCTP